MTRRTALTALGFAASIAGLAGCSPPTVSAACSRASECLPSVSYRDINHQTYAPAGLKGQVVVVNFWATWCPPCKKEIPAFNRVYGKYKDRGLVMLGVLSDNTVDDSGLLNFMSDNEFAYPVVVATPEILSAYEYPPALPVTFVYDRSGKLATTQRGEMSEAQLDSVLGSLLK